MGAERAVLVTTCAESHEEDFNAAGRGDRSQRPAASCALIFLLHHRIGSHRLNA
jgi:hypothetical protein